ncbi:MAG: formimidoylglutamate deiminase, partial [Alphaproteobacteria bacterium]|nr:formimidoylglutamate deiminase [Alphaproteobacteria bacterium]
MTVIHAKQMLTPEGWAQHRAVHIGLDGRIAAVTAQAGACDTTVDLLLPAAVNLHSHAFQRAMAGLTEMRGPDPSDSFWTWRRLMYRYLDRLTPEDIEAIAAQVFLEML